MQYLKSSFKVLTVKTLKGSLLPARGSFLYEKRPQSRELWQRFLLKES
jgi:hypothetical protein